MLNQVGELRAQYQLSIDQLDSMSDARGLANVINSGYDAVLDGDADSILREYNLPTSDDLGLTGSSASLYDMSRDSAEFLSRTRNALDQAKDRFSDLTGLINKVKGCPDQKDILDLQARIGAEETMLQNEQAKLLKMQAEAQAMAQMREEKIRQILIESA